MLLRLLCNTNFIGWWFQALHQFQSVQNYNKITKYLSTKVLKDELLKKTLIETKKIIGR